MVEAHRDLSVLLDEALGDDSWPSARAWHAAVIQQGLEAEEPSPRLLQRVLEICRGALDARGMDEARYLDPLFMRLETRKNPAQRSRALLETGGMEALLDQTSLP
jgi:hypothetical protein